MENGNWSKLFAFPLKHFYRSHRFVSILHSMRYVTEKGRCLNQKELERFKVCHLLAFGEMLWGEKRSKTVLNMDRNFLGSSPSNPNILSESVMILNAKMKKNKFIFTNHKFSLLVICFAHLSYHRVYSPLFLWYIPFFLLLYYK